MEIKGKVINVLPIVSGTSKEGKAWQLQPFVIETQEQYPRKVYIEIFGEKAIKDNPIIEGTIPTIHYDLESREFNGRWYTSVRAWKVVVDTIAQEVTQAVSNIPSASPANNDTQLFGDSSVLPF